MNATTDRGEQIQVGSILHFRFSILHFQAGRKGLLSCLKMENGESKAENVTNGADCNWRH
jgi:hypothetical protein